MNTKLNTGLEPLTSNGYIQGILSSSQTELIKRDTAHIMKTKGGKMGTQRGYASKYNSQVKSIEYDGFSTEVVEMIQGVVETLLGFPVEHTYSNGPRVYQAGTTLDLHVDHEKAMDMIIGVTVVIAAKGEHPKNFPLHVTNHKGEVVPLKLGIGGFAIYESWALPHGRLQPLAKNSTYTMGLFHFIPSGDFKGYPFHRQIKE